MIQTIELLVQNLAGWDKNPIRDCFAEGMKMRAKRGINEAGTQYPAISSSQ
jgi:hypothetical protein